MIQAIVQKKHLLQHPFYQLWLEGKLPKTALQRYAGQYYQLVEHLPRWISTLHSRSGDISVRQQLIQNLMEEELGTGNGNVPHTELWLDFAEELGVPRKTAETTPLLPATENVLHVITTLCQSSLAEGAAALYAYESQVPEISREKIKGLREGYGITSKKALRFFEVHKDADVKHRAVWLALARKQPEQGDAAEQTAQALWEMFDAMYEEFVPEEVKATC